MKAPAAADVMVVAVVSHRSYPPTRVAGVMLGHHKNRQQAPHCRDSIMRRSLVAALMVLWPSLLVSRVDGGGGSYTLGYAGAYAPAPAPAPASAWVQGRAELAAQPSPMLCPVVSFLAAPLGTSACQDDQPMRMRMYV